MQQILTSLLTLMTSQKHENFHRVLFRPAFAVQARELTQLQTILQNQIERFGEHIFKDGSGENT